MDVLSRDQWRIMGQPRVIEGARRTDPIPGAWLTPRETGTFQQHDVQIYVNGQIVERPCAVYLDDTFADTGEFVPPHVNAFLPDGPAMHVWEGGKMVTRQQWRPVDIYGEIEVRRCPPPDQLRDEIDALYVEEYGWTIAPDGRRLKPKRARS